MARSPTFLVLLGMALDAECFLGAAPKPHPWRAEAPSGTGAEQAGRLTVAHSSLADQVVAMKREEAAEAEREAAQLKVSGPRPRQCAASAPPPPCEGEKCRGEEGPSPPRGSTRLDSTH